MDYLLTKNVFKIMLNTKEYAMLLNNANMLLQTYKEVVARGKDNQRLRDEIAEMSRRIGEYGVAVSGSCNKGEYPITHYKTDTYEGTNACEKGTYSKAFTDEQKAVIEDLISKMKTIIYPEPEGEEYKHYDDEEDNEDMVPHVAGTAGHGYFDFNFPQGMFVFGCDVADVFFHENTMHFYFKDVVVNIPSPEKGNPDTQKTLIDIFREKIGEAIGDISVNLFDKDSRREIYLEVYDNCKVVSVQRDGFHYGPQQTDVPTFEVVIAFESVHDIPCE